MILSMVEAVAVVALVILDKMDNEMSYKVVEKLERLSFHIVLRSLMGSADIISFNFPVAGYKVDGDLIQKKFEFFQANFISQEKFEFDQYSSVTKKYRIDSRLIDLIADIGSTYESWSWDLGLPEDIILYRRDTDIILFESYSLDRANFAILSEKEIEELSEILNLKKVEIKDFSSYGDLEKLDKEQPRISAAIRTYLNKSP